MSMEATALGPEGLQTYRIDLDASPPAFEPIAGDADAILVPGFIDLQLNGGFEIDVASASEQSLSALAYRLKSLGYEAFCPTVVSGPAERALHALNAMPDDEMFLGLHLEGPFLSPNRPGAHPTDYIIDPPAGPSAWDDVLDHPNLRIVTLAPERNRAHSLIDRLASGDVTVSIGHTEATHSQVVEAIEAGATMLTHTYNAMSGLHHRKPGAVGAALLQDNLYCGLIYDRHHVCREAAQILLNAKPEDRVFAVSDATRALGLKDGARFEMWGQDCELKGGRVTLAGTETLAGSAISQYHNFRNLAEDFGLEAAIRLCCINPRKAIGMDEQPTIYLELDKEMNLKKRHRVAA